MLLAIEYFDPFYCSWLQPLPWPAAALLDVGVAATLSLGFSSQKTKRIFPNNVSKECSQFKEPKNLICHSLHNQYFLHHHLTHKIMHHIYMTTWVLNDMVVFCIMRWCAAFPSERAPGDRGSPARAPDPARCVYIAGVSAPETQRGSMCSFIFRCALCSCPHSFLQSSKVFHFAKWICSFYFDTL